MQYFRANPVSGGQLKLNSQRRPITSEKIFVISDLVSMHIVHGRILMVLLSVVFSRFIPIKIMSGMSIIMRGVIMSQWICPYISRHLLSLNPLQARCRRYSRGER